MADAAERGDGPVMDQNEVDALLAAMQSGALPADEGAAAGGAGAGPFGGAGGGGGGPHYGLAQAAVPYDFRHPQRLSKDRVHALEIIHQIFARNAGAALTGQFLAHIELRLDAVNQLTFSEFLLSLPTPTCCVLLQRPGQPGTVILEVNPTIAFPVIVLLLGRGRSPSPLPERSLTETEWSVLRTLIDPLVAELRTAWSTIKPTALEVVSQESTPQLLSVYPPNEPVVLLGFTLAVGEHSGPLNLCLPHAVIEPFLAELAERGSVGTPRREVREAATISMRQALLRVPVVAAGVLAEMTLTLRDILDMERDDRLETGRGREGQVTLTVEGRPFFHGELTIQRKRHAIRIEEEA
ncbi:MAG: FliM/FliN family flagellar motor switch protein [Planctomycetes bacterium]|nr:FliM/FliN family flagellar motor switch protein [Planctomycetota bacterium]